MRPSSVFHVCCVVAVLASWATAAESGGPKWHVVSVSSLLPSTVCTAAQGSPNSSAASVMHQHGPCSPPLARGGVPSHAEILDRDQDRVNSIRRKVTGASTTINPARASKSVSLPANSGISLGTGNYVVAVGVGTPARHYTVVFDTGSDLSWVQCKPCWDCYDQRDPLFDPAQSSSYSTVPCGSPECQALDTHGCSSDGKCQYVVKYEDQSATIGNLSRDTLTLAPSDELPGFLFGCGYVNMDQVGQVDGLIGLGRRNVSMSSQAAATYGAAFSYCLPSSSSAMGYLSLGGAAPSNARFTEMVTHDDAPSSYYLNLVGINVAGEDTRIPRDVFLTAGTIIDSGTVITRLPWRAYETLRWSFNRSMGSYKRAPALSILDTCYDLTGHKTVRIPSVTLVFSDGAEVNLDISGVLYVSKVSQACLAFASNGDDDSVSILGNTQQRTFAVVYDVANQKIGFGAQGCS
ncbi:hypothetical protein ACP70R_007711 [Stipagrostis hirtigluma subsp. patula]